MVHLGKWILRNRYLCSGVALLLGLLAGLQIRSLRMEDDEGTWFSADDPTLQMYRTFKEDFANTDLVVVAYSVEDIFSAEEIQYLDVLTGRLEALAHVSEAVSLANVDDIVASPEGLEIRALISSTEMTENEKDRIRARIAGNPFFEGGLVSRDGRTVAILVAVDTDPDEEKPLGQITEELCLHLRQLLAEEERRTGREFHLSGDIIKDGEIQLMMMADIEKFFPISMALSALLIWFLFGNLGAVLPSLLTVLVALVYTLGLKSLVDSPITPVSTTLFALITIIGLANAIHLISHYRLEMSHGKTMHAALLASYALAGRACFFTSLTTAIGFASLMVSRVPAIRHLGIFAAFGIMVAFGLAMIFVPGGILVFSIRIKAAGAPQHRYVNKMLDGISRFNRKYPRGILLLGAVIVFGLLLGIPRITVEGSMLKYLKPNTRLRRDTDFIDRNLVGISSLEVVIKGVADDFKDPENLAVLEKLQKRLLGHPKVSKAYALTDYLKLIYRELNDGAPQYYRIPASRELVAQSLFLYEFSGGENLDDYVSTDYQQARVSLITRQMNETERRALIADIGEFRDTFLGDFDVEITGLDTLISAVSDRLISTQVRSFGLAFVIILVTMLLVFGLRAGLVSVVPNVFPIVMVFGIMGYAGFDLNMATAIIASIAIGIVVDDTIHYFSHFRAQYQETGDRLQAMRNALLHVGPALLFTSAVLVLGFLIFLFSNTRILMDFGILSSLAVLTALLGDLFIGPVLLSRWEIFRKSAAEKSRLSGL